MSTPKVLALVMAGGAGSRLHPLTADRSKPAVPFGGSYRIVDFVLSNLINSGIHAIYLLVQYKSQSLIEHVRKAWVLSPITPSHFVTVVPPQMRLGDQWFQGTADAVYQNLLLIRRARPDLVAVFGADHVYRMDVRQMVDYHVRKGAEVTVSARPVAIGECAHFGVIAVDREGCIRGFQEKPPVPSPMPGDSTRCYASMGNYLFNTETLLAALEAGHRERWTDFGRHVLPALVPTGRVYAYDFTTNEVPGRKPYEEPAYWRDVGTIDAYFDAHRDLLGLEPLFDEFNTGWPIHAGNYLGPSARIVGGLIENSVVSAGTVVNLARISNSIIRREVIIDREVDIEDSIIMDYTVIGRGAHLRRVIVDRYNELPPGTIIGYSPEEDARRYHVSPGGVTVVAKGERGLERVFE
jgi:glucose-1-phosphate adenylyltransferase